MLLAVERAYPQSLDAAQRLIRLQLAHVSVRVQVHIGRTDHRGAIARTEPRGRAELPHLRPHDARIEGQRDQGGIAPLPIARPVLVRSQLEERLRARIERVQLFPTNRPSAVRNPCPLFKVDRIQGGAEPRPMSGGAAEVMQARGLERIVRQTDALTAVEVLHRRLVVETAAFEQQDLVPRADPFQRHADASRAGAYDAQVGFEHAAVRKGSSVDVHGGMSGGVSPREGRRERFGAPRLPRPPIPAAPSSVRSRSPARPARRWMRATVAPREWQRTARAPHSRWARARGSAVRSYTLPAVR